ncbi:MAG: DUF262 domain-containing HNH endonuclease family protein [Tychonema bourrellyi B0820]|uniref:DUF262 domain-containing protein n=1 Tax=Tychonema bourrellyi FEM_GT703 TaxID=2040638 RepID=A0A2G4EX92_9CYAN|nr:DUF262 domain-containing protein [Tychonema bourrellyi]MDQ2099446.1 DUF262 domain-containing HNH endonuclease family protein [Tychonema bourrellyi B0820]PHX54153.1 DUF262 domain-containing protein [Tychonema bourrellyi FEM_GT703]
MARTNLLETRTTSFGDLIGNGKIYRVPPFQRDYSWTEENWEDLWQDILMLHNNLSVSHYMGAIVLQSSATADKEFTVIDGQQRLATLSIIAVAVIEKIRLLVEQNVQPEANRERQEILKRTYLGDRDPRSLRYSSKLFLNENNDDFYQSNLVNLRKPLNIRSLSKSNQLLWQAFDYFSQELEKMPDIFQDGEKLTAFLGDTVAQRLLFIQISVEDELNAYTIFETLNARGLELTSTDLLKNYLFSLFQGPDDLKAAQRQWKRIINMVQMEEFPAFLRYYLSLNYSRVRRERLFKLVRESVKNAQQAFDLLDKLENFSSLFVALGSPNDEFWRDTPQNQPYIRALNLFRVKQVYPTLFAAYQKFSAEDFTRLLKLVVAISFRYSIVSSLNPNELELLYNNAALDITSGKITGTRQVFDALRPGYVKDEKFQQDFSLLSLSTKGQKRKLVRYIFCNLEADESGIEVNEDSFSIEHILPEVPTDEWRQNFTDVQIEEMVYRLGNLSLLEPSFNRDIGQKNYHIKREKYQQSVYALTKNILAEDWTPDAIAARQRNLARRAVHIWQSDFS